MVKSKWDNSEHVPKFNRVLKEGMDNGGLDGAGVAEALTLLVKECGTYSLVEEAYRIMIDGIKEVIMAVTPMEGSAKEPQKPVEGVHKVAQRAAEGTYKWSPKKTSDRPKQPDFGWGKDSDGSWAVFIPQEINAEDYANSFVWVVNKSGKKSKVFITTLDHECDGGFIFKIDQDKTQAEREKYFNSRQ